MEVKIIKSGKEDSWYSDKIGEIFKVVELNEDYYQLDLSYVNIVLPKEDVEIIQDFYKI